MQRHIWSQQNFKMSNPTIGYEENISSHSSSSYILRRPHNFAKSSPYFWLQYTQSKVRGRFRKILWSSQNIWTLVDSATKVTYMICFDKGRVPWVHILNRSFFPLNECTTLPDKIDLISLIDNNLHHHTNILHCLFHRRIYHH